MTDWLTHLAACHLDLAHAERAVDTGHTAEAITCVWRVEQAARDLAVALEHLRVERDRERRKVIKGSA